MLAKIAGMTDPTPTTPTKASTAYDNAKVRTDQLVSSTAQLTSAKVGEAKVLWDRGYLDGAFILGLQEQPAGEGEDPTWAITGTLGMAGWDRTGVNTMAQQLVPIVGNARVETMLTWDNGLQERLVIDAGLVRYQAL